MLYFVSHKKLFGGRPRKSFYLKIVHKKLSRNSNPNHEVGLTIQIYNILFV